MESLCCSYLAAPDVRIQFLQRSIGFAALLGKDRWRTRIIPSRGLGQQFPRFMAQVDVPRELV